MKLEIEVSDEIVEEATDWFSRRLKLRRKNGIFYLTKDYEYKD